MPVYVGTRQSLLSRKPVVQSTVPVNPDTAGLVLQMLGSAGTSSTVNNDPLSSWTDQTVLATVFSQATGGLQPTYVASEINGLPGTRYNGSQYFVASGAIAALNISSLKIFAVVMVTGGAGTARAIFSNRNSIANLGYEMLADANDNWRLLIGTGTGTSVTAGGTVDSNAHVITGIFVASPPSFVLRVDGTQVSADSDTIAPNITIAPAIGTASNNVGTEKLIGDLPELLIYDTTIHNPSTTAIEGYLKSKYNTP